MDESPEKQKVLEHLEQSKAVVAAQLLGDIDDDGYTAAGTFLTYFVEHCGGMIQADGEGFYEGDQIIVDLDQVRLITGWRRERSLVTDTTMAEYEIDGKNFSTLEEFYDEISRVLIPDAWWGRNLDAFNDILRGGFGTPEGGFTLRWLNHEESRRRLGYDETARQLELTLQRCHPSNQESVAAELAQAQARRGPTVFDWLIEIIRIHSQGGEEAEDGVELVLL